MNQFIANISHAFTNLHVSVPVALGVVCKVAPIWVPHYADQFNATSAVLLGYGVIAAANTPPAAQTPTPPSKP